MKSIQLFDKTKGINAVITVDGEMVSLTDIWKSEGSPSNKEVKRWLESEPVNRFIKTVSNLLKVGISDVIKVKRGKGGGTWAHKQIALEYTQYLNPELAVLVNQVFFERIEEQKNPDLIVDRAISTYQKQGKSAQWIAKRIEGKVKRNEFTSVLAQHGCDRDGFRNCTNGIYTPLFGGGTNVIRSKKNLPESASIRDSLSPIELEAVKFAEALAAEGIERQNLQGNGQCEAASVKASTIIAKGVKEYFKGL